MSLWQREHVNGLSISAAQVLVIRNVELPTRNPERFVGYTQQTKSRADL